MKMEPSKFAMSRRKRKIINLCVETFDSLDMLQSVPPDLFVSTQEEISKNLVECIITRNSACEIDDYLVI